jgi:hypothetical protein
MLNIGKVLIGGDGADQVNGPLNGRMAQEVTREQIKGLDEQVQEIKSDVLASPLS